MNKENVDEKNTYQSLNYFKVQKIEIKNKGILEIFFENIFIEFES